MLTEEAVFCSDTPICSAIDMNRLLNTSSITGSASVPIACWRASGTTRVSTRWFLAVTSRPPAVLDHDGLVRFDDDGRAVDRVTGRKLVAGEDRRVVPGAAGIEARRAARRRAGGTVVVGKTDLGEIRSAADRLDRDGFDDELLGRVDEAEARFVRGFERGFHLVRRREAWLPSSLRGGIGVLGSLGLPRNGGRCHPIRPPSDPPPQGGEGTAPCRTR